MSNPEIIIVVEGPTEQTFVRDVLAPEMGCRGISLSAARIGKPGHKGGDVHFERAKNDIRTFLKQRENTYVSTMFDYFRIDVYWPGRSIVCQQIESGITLSVEQKANILESATKEKIIKLFPDCNAEERFIPYIEMHEFEALLFSDTSILAKKTGIAIADIEKILVEYGDDPEAINDDPKKAPSKRLETLKKGYKKIITGKTVSEAIGIQNIRQKCRHFDSWLKKLENLTDGRLR